MRTRVVLAAAALLVAIFASAVHAQRFRSFGNLRVANEADFDGTFQFCRVYFQNGPYGDPNSGSWEVDFPRADINLSIRLSEMTRTHVGRDAHGDPKTLIVRLTSPTLFSCPFVMMTEVGAADLSAREIAGLREYLLKGGFLWADDFWGTEAWEWWAQVMGEILPGDEYPIIDLTPEHPLYHAQFTVRETPQIANIGHWSRYGDGRERGSDSPQANTRAVLDKHGNIMVLMTHNSDFGDSFEREADDPSYFTENSVPGYAFGINTLLYALTH
jgi:hypothetical protein